MPSNQVYFNWTTFSLYYFFHLLRNCDMAMLEMLHKVSIEASRYKVVNCKLCWKYVSFCHILSLQNRKREYSIQLYYSLWLWYHMEVGCPTTYSCHVDSVLLNSKFEANRSEYWNSKFKYSQIEYSNIFRRTWCFQISFLIFEDSKIGRWHFPSLHS